jgi:pyruvate dehydrogenase E2 component (dihydrolipoamide acetyltransferase)
MMPQLGETVTEGTIIRWLKQPGDAVAVDEPLFEVSTDKVDSEVPSSASGYLASILVAEGATVDVGTKLAVITAEQPAGGAGAEAAAPAAAPAPAPAAPAAPAVAAAPPPPPAPPLPPPPPPAVAAEPAPGEQAEEVADDAEGARSRLLSPVVRKLIAEHQLDQAAIAGTGPGGRITRGDVLAFIDGQAHAGAPAPAAAAPAAAPAPAVAPAAPPRPAAPAAAGEAGRDEIVPFTNIRRRTAEHMVRSKATSAHTLVAVETDFENVERVRREHKDRFRAEEGISLNYLPFVARAVIEVLRSYPNLNASVGDDALVVHRDIHLGIAVDLDMQGLIAPVVHHADGQSLRGLARAIADLATRARTRRLSADDISGGTFTITNPGPFGTFITVPIINQPQVAILSTDGVRRRPVVVEMPDGGEGIAIHSVGMLALSFDHRAVDGAYASAFVRDVGRAVETRDWAAEL